MQKTSAKLLVLAVLLAVCGFGALALFHGAGPASADTSIDSEEQIFINDLNSYREANSLPPLLIDPSLQAAADWMSTDLGTRTDNVFDHTDSTGRDPWTRMCDFGYCYNTWKGENIAAGYTTGDDVFAAWKASPGHNANMLGANYVVMGLARVYTQGSTYGWYWTNDFGGQVADPSPPPAPTNTPSPTSSPTPTPTVIVHPTATRATTPTPTPAPTNAPSPTATPTPPPTPTPTPSPSSSPTPVVVDDDVNCDSLVTGADSVRILEFISDLPEGAPGCPLVGSAQPQTPHGGARYLGDLDCNGIVDGRDALIILRYIAGDPPNTACNS